MRLIISTANNVRLREQRPEMKRIRLSREQELLIKKNLREHELPWDGGQQTRKFIVPGFSRTHYQRCETAIDIFEHHRISDEIG